MEKKIAEVTVRLPDALKQDLQDMAAHDDRTLSETIRIILETSLYGMKARQDQLCLPSQQRHASRGN